MIIERDGNKIELTKKELELAYIEQQKKYDREKLLKCIDSLVFYEEMPPISDKTKKEMIEYALEEYRNKIDTNQEISEIEEDCGKDAIMMYIDKLPVKGAYVLSNTGSVNIYYINDDHTFAGINHFNPAWYELDCDYNGDFFFEIGELKIPVNKVMQVSDTN